MLRECDSLLARIQPLQTSSPVPACTKTSPTSYRQASLPCKRCKPPQEIRPNFSANCRHKALSSRASSPISFSLTPTPWTTSTTRKEFVPRFFLEGYSIEKCWMGFWKQKKSLQPLTSDNALL